MALNKTNLSALAPITTAATALSNLILVSPQSVKGYQPMNPASKTTTSSAPSLLFHYEGENTVELSSDITDHYVEDNTAIQDQWALRPEKVTVHGFIGELNDIAPGALAILQQAAQKLTIISAYTPVLSETALLAYTEATLAYEVASGAVNSAVSSWSSLTGANKENTIGSNGLGDNVNLATATISNSQTKQQIAFQQFYAYWRARWLFTVQTPWAVFSSMAIENIRAVQDDTTNMITDFYITFKLIRTAQALTTGNTLESIRQARNGQMAQPVSSNGTQTPAPDKSLAVGLSLIGSS